jgi:hypothetical protein
VLSLFPVPEYKITASLNGIERVVVAEENLGGLYRSVIRPLFGDTMDVIGVNNIGSMITPLDIMNKVI